MRFGERERVGEREREEEEERERERSTTHCLASRHAAPCHGWLIGKHAEAVSPGGETRGHGNVELVM